MFPYKEYDTLNTANLFGDFELSDLLKEIFAKLVLNYPNYEMAQTIPEDKKPLLSQYIEFLRKTYFTKEQATYNEELNDSLFNYEKWNSMADVLSDQQSFLRDDFIRLYNQFVEIQFNMLLAIATNSHNEFIHRLNKIYDENKFEGGKLIFDLLTIEKFSKDLQNKYNNYIALKESGMDNVALVKELPETFIPLTHFMVEE